MSLTRAHDSPRYWSLTKVRFRARKKESVVLTVGYKTIATSAVDLDTDAAIQEIIRGQLFHHVTILTIAYVVESVMNYDD